MEYIVIFTFENEKYAVKVLATEKERAILQASQQMLNDYRHFDSVEAVVLL